MFSLLSLFLPFLFFFVTSFRISIIPSSSCLYFPLCCDSLSSYHFFFFVFFSILATVSSAVLALLLLPLSPSPLFPFSIVFYPPFLFIVLIFLLSLFLPSFVPLNLVSSRLLLLASFRSLESSFSHSLL